MEEPKRLLKLSFNRTCDGTWDPLVAEFLQSRHAALRRSFAEARTGPCNLPGELSSGLRPLSPLYSVQEPLCKLSVRAAAAMAPRLVRRSRCRLRRSHEGS